METSTLASAELDGVAIAPAELDDVLITAPPELSVVWTDPVTGHKGYLVVDRLIDGLATGGLRMHPGSTFDETRRLAALMGVKEALHHDPSRLRPPMGGAKGAIDFDPSDRGAHDVLARFLVAVEPYLESLWTTGDDLGTSTELIEDSLRAIGMDDGGITAALRRMDDPESGRRRLAEGLSVVVDGIPLAELVGGRGVAESALTVLDRAGIARDEATAVVQGFGSMGGATARFLAEAGVRVVAIADVDGTVSNPNGLPVEDLLRDRLPFGRIDRSKLRAEDVAGPAGSWIDVETDVLVLAAVSWSVTSENQQQVKARHIVEAANLPVTRQAEQLLAARGVPVVPDVVANSGTNAWWWWVLFGDIEPTAQESFAMIRQSLGGLVLEMLDLATSDGILLRDAALRMARARSARVQESFGRP